MMDLAKLVTLIEMVMDSPTTWTIAPPQPTQPRPTVTTTHLAMRATATGTMTVTQTTPATVRSWRTPHRQMRTTIAS